MDQPSGGGKVARQAGKRVRWWNFDDFCRIWLICRNRPICYLNHSFATEIGAVSREPRQREDKASICFEFYTLKYIKLSEFSLPRPLHVAQNRHERLGLSN
jgi:hypothetical protein